MRGRGGKVYLPPILRGMYKFQKPPCLSFGGTACTIAVDARVFMS